jgi:hypothetical protein
VALGVAVWASLEVAVLTLHALARGNKLLPFKKKIVILNFWIKLLIILKSHFSFSYLNSYLFLFLILISNSCGPSQNLRMLAFKQGTPHIKY